jgi:hypothetical protein
MILSMTGKAGIRHVEVPKLLFLNSINVANRNEGGKLPLQMHLDTYPRFGLKELRWPSRIIFLSNMCGQIDQQKGASPLVGLGIPTILDN